MWHIVLLPLCVVAPGRDPRPDGPPAGGGAAVRRPRAETTRGLADPHRSHRRRRWRHERRHQPAAKARKFKPDRDVADWHGRYVPYDLAKEFLVALVVVVVLVAGLAVVFGSPDDQPVTVKSWSTGRPGRLRPDGDHRARRDERDGAATGRPTTPTARRQSIGPLSPEKWVGVHHPIDTAQDYVLGPLSHPARRPRGPGRRRRVQRRRRPPSRQPGRRPTRRRSPTPRSPTASCVVPTGDYGPVGHADRRRDGDGPQRRARRRPAQLPPVLRDRLHQAAPVHRRRPVPGQPGRPTSTCRATSGG